MCLFDKYSTHNTCFNVEIRKFLCIILGIPPYIDFKNIHESELHVLEHTRAIDHCTSACIGPKSAS